MIVHDVEQGSAEWFHLRAGKPSSSRFGSLITGTGKPSEGLREYADELAMETYLGMPADDGFGGNKYTKRGKILESETIMDYQMTHQVKVTPVGFITDDLVRWGASTDGLVGDDGCVEVKNLIAKNFWKLLQYTRKHDKTPPMYIPQIQGELFVTEREWVDIIFYHPQFDPITYRHTPDKKFHQLLEAQLKACIAERNIQLAKVRS